MENQLSHFKWVLYVYGASVRYNLNVCESICTLLLHTFGSVLLHFKFSHNVNKHELNAGACTILDRCMSLKYARLHSSRYMLLFFVDFFASLSFSNSIDMPKRYYCKVLIAMHKCKHTMCCDNHFRWCRRWYCCVAMRNVRFGQSIGANILHRGSFYNKNHLQPMHACPLPMHCQFNWFDGIYEIKFNRCIEFYIRAIYLIREECHLLHLIGSKWTERMKEMRVTHFSKFVDDFRPFIDVWGRKQWK